MLQDALVVHPIDAVVNAFCGHRLPLLLDDSGDMIVSVERPGFAVFVEKDSAGSPALELILATETVFVNWRILLDVVDDLPAYRLASVSRFSYLPPQLAHTRISH